MDKTRRRVVVPCMIRLLTVSLALALAGGCGTGGGTRSDGLSRDEEAALEDRVSAAEAARQQAEVDKAQAEADKAQAEADKAQAEADKAQAEADKAQAETEADEAQAEADEAQAEADEAQAEADEAQAEAEAAKQATLSMEASLALASLTNGATLPLPSISPKHRAPAIVSVPGVTFTGARGSTAGRWYVTTLSNRGATSQDDMVVYSDVGAPVSTAIAEVYSSFTEGDQYLTINIVADDHKGLIRSSAFPSSASTINIPLTVDSTPDDNDDTNDRTQWFSGTFDGAAGSFQCAGTGAEACSVRYTGASYILGDGTWTFRTSKGATVRVPDDSYMDFGWWRKQIIATGAFSYGVFSNPGTPVSASDFPTLEGTATYVGPAVGQYAIYQPLGSESNHGAFTATARLSANFDTDRISGAVTGFDVNSDWSVTLKETSMAGGTITAGDVSWTIGGNTQDGGNWNGMFHSEITPHVDTHPEGVTGTFDAQYSNVGRMVGAFGATR